jgi:hypothetical protein
MYVVWQNEHSVCISQRAQCASVRMTSLLMVLTKIVGFIGTARNAQFNCIGSCSDVRVKPGSARRNKYALFGWSVLCKFQYLWLCCDLIAYIIIFTERVGNKELCVLVILLFVNNTS